MPAALPISPEQMRRWSRINVVGTSGSGKSTYAKRLAAILHAPHIEMDALFWGPNWTQASDNALAANLAAALAAPKWVLDGNYTRTIPIKWAQVDAVIWLDLPFALTLRQAITRAAIRAWRKDELWPGTGNRENFRKSFFSRDSVIAWTIKTYAKTRRNYESLMADPRFAHICFVRLQSWKQAEILLQMVEREVSSI